MNNEVHEQIPTVALNVGLLEGRYDITEVIRSNPLGVTYKALDYGTNKTVSIEVYYDFVNIDDRALKRFYEDVELLSDTKHESILKTHHVFKVTNETILGQQFESTHAYVMDYVSGKSLAKYLNEGFDDKTINSIFIKLLEALHDIHISGVVHKNISPSSIILDSDLTPYIGHFGPLRSITEEDFIKLHHDVERAQYIHPQFYDQSLESIQADLYALGIVLTELLSRSDRSTAASAASKLANPAKVNHAAPKALLSSFDKRYHYIAKRATRESKFLRYESAYKMMRDFSHPAKYFSEALSIRSAVMAVDTYENKFYIPSAAIMVNAGLQKLNTVQKALLASIGCCALITVAGLANIFLL